MLRINGKEYSGQVFQSGQEKLTVVINTVEAYQDVVDGMTNVKEITEFFDGGIERTFAVTRPISAKIVSPYVYAIDFSTEMSYKEMIEKQLQEQSAAIDDILVAFLEG